LSAGLGEPADRSRLEGIESFTASARIHGAYPLAIRPRDDYVYLVPFVEDDKLIVLKTIIPSRKATKQYLEKEADDHEA
jgi:hypothetical protein